MNQNSTDNKKQQKSNKKKQQKLAIKNAKMLRDEYEKSKMRLLLSKVREWSVINKKWILRKCAF